MSRSLISPSLLMLAAVLAMGICPGVTGPARAQDGPGAIPPGVPDRILKREQFIVVGRISNNAQKTQPRLERLADWLARRLEPHGVLAGAGLVARNLGEMGRFLREGRVDVVSESVLAAIHLEDTAGAEVVLREWKRGRPTYQSVFIAERESEIYQLSHLAGRRIAFEDKGSTTAFLLPMAVLRSAGLEMVHLSAPEQVVPQGKVGYVFVGSEINIAAWTARGLVDAGAYSNRDWERRKRTPERYRKRLRVFNLTDPLPRSVLLVRNGLPPALRKGVIESFLEIGDAPGAGKVRKDYYDIERYDEFDGEAAKSLENARNLYRKVDDLLE